MKLIYIIIVIVAISFLGCSSTYTIGDFTSKQKFYEDYNKFARDKNVKIMLDSDSAFYSNNITKIDNDTLYVLNSVTVKREFTISSNEIKKIHYMNADYKTANILLENGERIKAENITAFSDSMKFLGAKEQFVKSILSPIDKVKAISYKDKASGIVRGVIPGFLTGATIGFLNQIIVSGIATAGTPVIVGSVSGIIAGSLIGWLIGHKYIYQFN